MWKLLGVVAGVVLMVTSQPVAAQLKGSGTTNARLALAFCAGGGACQSNFNFRAGLAKFKKIKQPKVLTRRVVGLVYLNGVSTNGPPIPASLDATFSGRLNYDSVESDPTPAPCSLLGAEVTQEFATSSMTCNTAAAGTKNCRGDIVLNAGVMDDEDCADVQLFISDVVVEVYEDGGVGDDNKKIAVNGIHATGQTPDCNSGGPGCP